jgi:membrane-bound ClpP family serine protease
MKAKGEPSTLKLWLIVLIALLDDAAALVLIFLALWYFGVDIPLWAMVLIGLVAGTFIFVLHRAVVPSLRRRKVTGAEGMLGQTGEVARALRPEGTVMVGGEYWQAKSLDGDIDKGEEVEITGIDGLRLEVRRKQP